MRSSSIETLIKRLVLLLLLPLAAAFDLGTLELQNDDSERHETPQLRTLIEKVVGDHPSPSTAPRLALPSTEHTLRLQPTLAILLDSFAPAVECPSRPVYLEQVKRTLLLLPVPEEPPSTATLA